MKCQRCNKKYNGTFNMGYYCDICISENDNIDQLVEIEGHNYLCALKQVFENNGCICGNEKYEN